MEYVYFLFKEYFVSSATIILVVTFRVHIVSFLSGFFRFFKEAMSDGKMISSRRVLSLSTLATLMYMVVHYAGYEIVGTTIVPKLNTNILIGLICIIIAVPIISSMSEVIQVLQLIRGNKPDIDPVPPKV